MSILDSLLRFIDPVEHRERQAQRRRAREVRPSDADGDPADEPVSATGRPTPLMECRVCHRRDRTVFCPDCLAQTMEPVRERR
jgi:hypothetical protein